MQPSEAPLWRADGTVAQPTRTLVVDLLTFRWAWDRAAGELTVWHALDAGRLTVAVGFPPSEALVTRVVRIARDTGWNTAEHLTLRVPVAPEVVEPIGMSSAEDVLAVQIQRLDVPDPASTPADALIQAVYVPIRGATLAVTATVRDGQGHVALQRLRGASTEVWRGICASDEMLDAVVATLGTRRAPTRDGLRVEELTVRAAVRSARGLWTETGAAGAGPVRTAAVGAWRLALRAFDDPEARRALWGLHAVLEPEEIPLEREGRVIRLFGRWGWPNGAVVLRALGAGPWVLDLTGVASTTEPFRDALLAHLLAHDLPIALAGELDGFDTHRTAEAAAAALVRDATLRAAQAVDALFDVPVRGWVRDGLRGDAAGIAIMLAEIEGRLTEPWRELTPPDDLTGYLFAGGTPAWTERLTQTGLLVNPTALWVRTPSGRTFVAPLRAESVNLG